MFPSQSAPLLGSAEQQRCWFGLTCGHSGLNLVSRVACASCCVLLPASLYSPIPSGWAPEMTLGWDQSRGSHVVTHNAGKCLDVLLGLLFLTEKQKTGRRPLYVVLHWPMWYCTGLKEGQCGQHVAPSPTLPVQPALVSVVWTPSHPTLAHHLVLSLPARTLIIKNMWGKRNKISLSLWSLKICP